MPEREGSAAFCFPDCGPSTPPRPVALWGRERADFCRLWIRELGNQFDFASRTMSRMGSPCHARPGAQASAPRPWHLAISLWGSFGQKQ